MTKYERIYKDLETKINKDFYKEGDFLPTEIELSQQYQASRDTVCKALSLLTKAGLILTWHPSD
ncbi:HTH-type transcriptional regulator ymfC [Streptococcus pyogenes]|nr:HTH-type transcriptional regulator ymfC [Streptococcus pyogenes]